MQQVIEGFRLSPQQRYEWQLAQEGGAPRLCRGVLRLAGELDPDALDRALGTLAERHEILRTAFERLPGMEMPIQVIAEEATFAACRVDLTDRSAAERPAALERILADDLARPFDSGQAPLTRATLVRTAPDEHVLVWTLSALVADEGSLIRLLEELGGELGGAGPAAPDTEHDEDEEDDEPLQYVQYSEWLHELQDDEDGDEAREFWRLEAERATPAPALPDEGEGVTVAGPDPVAIRRLDGDRLRDLERVAETLKADLPEVLATAWQVLLGRLSGASDVVIGRHSDGRSFEELAEACGPFARYLPVRAALPPASRFDRAMERAGRFWASASEWQDFHFPEPATAPVDLFEDRGNLDEADKALDYGALVATRVSIHRPWPGGRLRLAIGHRSGSLELELSADPERFAADAIERLADRLVALLDDLSEGPSQVIDDLDVLGVAERRRLLEAWNDTATDFEDQPIHRLFEAQVDRTPEAVALVADHECLRFRQLDERANRLAHLLRRQGVGPEVLVALCLDRSLDQVVALLATLKAGGVYVPLDPGQPTPRLKAMLADALEGMAEPVVLSTDRHRERLASTLGAAARILALDQASAELAEESSERLDVAVASDQAAYVIYTSGSTGRPKGTTVCHRSLANLAAALRRALDHDGEGLRVSLNAPLGFDSLVKQWLQWLDGHGLYLVPEEVRLDGGKLLAWLQENSIDVFDCTPSQLKLLLQAGLTTVEDPSPRCILVGGEAIDAGLWQVLAADRGRRYVNVYGPTECTVDTAVAKVSESALLPVIGRPIANVRTYVVDRRLRPVPQGMAGELVIGGQGVARGYRHRPAMTAEVFVPDPFHGEDARLYRTGDRVRHLADGSIEFLGRLDHQVKLRGMRIELGEVENVLLDHPAVAEAVAVVRRTESASADESSPADDRLVAYVVPGGGAVATADGRFRLPNGMVVAQQNRNETEYLYQEIFEKESYVQHGVELPEDAVVLDVGANIGMFSLFVSQRAPGATIYAFEPLAPIRRALESNAAQCTARVEVFDFGLSAEETSTRLLYYPRYSMMSGQASYARPDSEIEVIKRFLRNEEEQGSGAAGALLAEADELLAGRFEGEEHECRMRRLTDVIREQAIERVDLLKIDVQRAELDVLRGLADDDWGRIDQIVMEVHDAPDEATSGRLEEIRSLLDRHGFDMVAEADELLVGTDRYNVYAVRRGLVCRPAAPSTPAPALAETAALDTGELRDWLHDRLPEYMLPAAFVELPELPLTRRGKLDRQALPAPEDVASAAEEELEAPRTPFEELLAGIWKEVLGIERVGADSSFFDLGGHSLLATQLMSRVRQAFGIEMPLRNLFEAPTLSGLASQVAAARQAGEGLEPPPPIEPVSRDQPLPLAFAQQRLWFIDQLEPGDSSYNSPRALHFQGTLDRQAFRDALNEIVRRHEVLRTTYHQDGGEPRQEIHPPAPLDIPCFDLASMPPDERLEEALRLGREEARKPFDLATGPLIRTTLLRLDEDDHVVLFTLHHIVSDGWSMGILVREVAALYDAFSQGRPSPLKELSVQYADFAHWQRQWMSGDVLDAHLDYWRDRLAGELPPLKLPKRKAPPEDGATSGSAHFSLPGEVLSALRDVAEQERATLFMALLAVVQTMLYRLSDQSDVRVGTDIANRNQQATEKMIGFFVNLLVLRTDLAGNPSFRELLRRVRDVTLGAYAHQDLPFEKLVETLSPGRQAGRTPLFQVLVVLQNAPDESLQLGTAKLSALDISPGESKFDLALFMAEAGDELQASWRYDATLFEAELIAAMSRQLEALVREFVLQPETRIDSPELLPELAQRKNLMTTKRKPKTRRKFSSVKPKAVGLTDGELIKTSAIGETPLPLMIQPAFEGVDLLAWAEANREFVDLKLRQHGGLLFRGFGNFEAQEFERFARSLCNELLSDYGDLPNEAEDGRVYHSTPYPEDKTILFHNESSHQWRWPMRQWFLCVQPSEVGGKTPIVDCRRVYERLDPQVRQRFEEKGLMYVRNFTEGLDVSWQGFFGTDDKTRVEQMCEAASLEWEWRPDNGLRTKQICPAVTRHLDTGELLFFNQIQLHHISMLEDQERDSLVSLFGEDGLPRNVYYGDGTPIDDELVRQITDLYWQLCVEFPWQRGDLLMVDNMIVAHARRPYKEPRKVLVAMGDIVSAQADA